MGGEAGSLQTGEMDSICPLTPRKPQKPRNNSAVALALSTGIFIN